MKFASVKKFACVLSLTSIFSIGFASWTVTTPKITPVEITGGMQTDYVIKADDYVSFDNGDTDTVGDGVVLPEYNADGFVTTITNDGNTVYENSETADMVLYLVVDYDKCQELIAREETTMNISVTFTLQTNANAFFNDTLAEIKSISAFGAGSAMPGISTNTAVIDGKTVRVGYTVFITGYKFSDLTQNQNGQIELKIPFTAKTEEAKKNIAECLNGNQFVFNTSVHSY